MGVSLNPRHAFDDLTYSLEGYGTALSVLLAIFLTWLYLPDPGVVEIMLATYVANLIAGDPVWVLLVGGPSSGKTEPLNPLRYLPHMFEAGTITEAALLSGTSSREREANSTGGLLQQMGKFGLLLIKDFTSVLSMNGDARMRLLAAFREVFDGRGTRILGTDGGKSLTWEGKMGLIGGVTSAIDAHHGLVSSMGERFVFYRLDPPDGEKQAQKVADNVGLEDAMRGELRDGVEKFFKTLDLEAACPISTSEEGWLIALSSLVVKCRSAVDRHGHSREVELVHEPEAPARLMRILTQLLKGLKLIGVPPERQKQRVVKTGMDSIPPLRRLVLEYLANREKPAEITEIATAAEHYSTQTIRRSIEELECHKVVENVGEVSKAEWRLFPYWQERYRRVMIGIQNDNDA